MFLGKRWSQQNHLSLNSVSAQLLLWIALPAALALLVISLIEIRSHEQAMQRLVQARASSLVQATTALLTTQVEHSQAVLHTIAAALPTNAASLFALQHSLFSAGIVAFDHDGQPVNSLNTDVTWAADPQIIALVSGVLQGKADALLTLYNEEQQTWLLIQAVTIPEPNVAAVLVGARVLDAESLRASIRSFLQSDTAELHIENNAGQILAELASVHSANAPQTTTKIISAQSIVPKTGWRVLLREHWSELVPPELRYENVVFTGVVMAIIFSLLAAYIAVRNIITPLRQLDWAASQIGWGNFAAIQAPVGGVTEIEDLRLAMVGMADKIRQYQQELQDYIGAITIGQEEERKRLARELHDGTVQTLIALNQQVELAEKEMERQPPQAAARLRSLRPLLTETISNLRHQIHDLRPLYLEDLGFLPALEMLLQQASQHHHLLTSFTVKGNTKQSLTPMIELSLFRIVQEAIQNVVSHANAGSLTIEVLLGERGVTLNVADNGSGFVTPNHPHLLASTGHYGLLGMQERAQLHGGKLQIKSETGKGTIVTVWLPILPTETTSPTPLSR